MDWTKKTTSTDFFLTTNNNIITPILLLTINQDIVGVVSELFFFYLLSPKEKKKVKGNSFLTQYTSQWQISHPIISEKLSVMKYWRAHNKCFFPVHILLP